MAALMLQQIPIPPPSTPPPPPVRKDPFGVLSVQLALRVLGYLTLRELCVISTVCKQWNALSSNNELWMRPYSTTFNVDFATMQHQQQQQNQPPSAEGTAQSGSPSQTRATNWKLIFLRQRRFSVHLSICQQEKHKLDSTSPSAVLHNFSGPMASDISILEIATSLGYDDVVAPTLFKLIKNARTPILLNDVKKILVNLAITATKKGYEELLRQFVMYNPACALITDSDGNTPLHITRTKETLYLLLKAKASTLVPNKQGAYPIHTAAASGAVEVVRALTDSNSINLKTRASGDTPINLASYEGHLAVVRLLAACGADPKVANNNGQTALHMAAKGNRRETALFLLEKGCKPTALDSLGNSPIDVCSAHKHFDLAVILLEKAGKIIPYSTLSTLSAKHIGAGAFGDVYLATINQRQVAVKKVRHDKLVDAGKEPSWILEKFILEAALMHKLSNNPNFVSMIGASLTPPDLCLVLEYMAGGSLEDVLHGTKRGKQQLPSVNAIAKCIAEGMKFLHSQSPQIIHRDLTSANILLDQNGTPKIADFGISRFKVEVGDQTMTYIGNPRWRAPEVTRGERYSSKVDVYSFGLILWELITGKLPFYDLDGTPASMHAAKGKRPEMPSDCHPQWAELIQLCWQDNPSRRPNFGQILETLSTLPVVQVPTTSVNPLQVVEGAY
ncbi:Serine/threonine-protein kinase STY46 [Pelomyxa schiedti]|nr:Serine/threonine-protein kinase STY46 [Pelomyxa schiedti]